MCTSICYSCATENLEFQHYRPLIKIIIVTGTDAESDDSYAKEEAALRLPPEFAELLMNGFLWFEVRLRVCQHVLNAIVV